MTNTVEQLTSVGKVAAIVAFVLALTWRAGSFSGTTELTGFIEPVLCVGLALLIMLSMLTAYFGTTPEMES